jgi:hypothetical protein
MALVSMLGSTEGKAWMNLVTRNATLATRVSSDWTALHSLALVTLGALTAQPEPTQGSIDIVAERDIKLVSQSDSRATNATYLKRQSDLLHSPAR